LIALAVALIAPAALAQFPVIKTDPLATSDSVQLGVSTHIPFAPRWAGYAGAIVKAHLLDNQELDVTGFHPLLPVRTPSGRLPASTFISNPFGAPSANLQSVPIQVTYWQLNARQSGINVVPSQLIRLATLTIHAKNTTPANNSDVDATFMLWNIWHLRFFNTISQIVPLERSDQLWVSSNVTLDQLHVTTPAFFSAYRFPPLRPTPFDPNAHWLHLSETLPFHLTGAGSAFYATFVGTIGLGIEHVPEPASGLLVAGGVLALALGSHARRRRVRMA
jgi:hypothetical protein